MRIYPPFEIHLGTFIHKGGNLLLVLRAYALNPSPSQAHAIDPLRSLTQGRRHIRIACSGPHGIWTTCSCTNILCRFLPGQVSKSLPGDSNGPSLHQCWCMPQSCPPDSPVPLHLTRLYEAAALLSQPAIPQSMLVCAVSQFRAVRVFDWSGHAAIVRIRGSRWTMKVAYGLYLNQIRTYSLRTKHLTIFNARTRNWESPCTVPKLVPASSKAFSGWVVQRGGTAHPGGGGRVGPQASPGLAAEVGQPSASAGTAELVQAAAAAPVVAAVLAAGAEMTGPYATSAATSNVISAHSCPSMRGA